MGNNSLWTKDSNAGVVAGGASPQTTKNTNSPSSNGGDITCGRGGTHENLNNGGDRVETENCNDDSIPTSSEADVAASEDANKDLTASQKQEDAEEIPTVKTTTNESKDPKELLKIEEASRTPQISNPDDKYPSSRNVANEDSVPPIAQLKAAVSAVTPSSATTCNTEPQEVLLSESHESENLQRSTAAERPKVSMTMKPAPTNDIVVEAMPALPGADDGLFLPAAATTGDPEQVPNAQQEPPVPSFPYKASTEGFVQPQDNDVLFGRGGG